LRKLGIGAGNDLYSLIQLSTFLENCFCKLDEKKLKKANRTYNEKIPDKTEMVYQEFFIFHL